MRSQSGQRSQSITPAAFMSSAKKQSEPIARNTWRAAALWAPRSLAGAVLAILGRRDVQVSAEDPVEMALIGKSTQQRDLLQREPILAQVLARVLHLAAEEIGMRPHPVMHIKFARELHRCAVADVGQFLKRDVPGNVMLD